MGLGWGAAPTRVGYGSHLVMRNNVTSKGTGSFLPPHRGNRNSWSKDKEQVENSRWLKNQRVVTDEHSDGSGTWGAAKASPQTLKELFFPVLYLPLDAFYLSHPNPCVYVTELSKPVYKAFPQLFQALLAPFRTRFRFTLTGLWHSGSKEQIRNHSSPHEQEEKHVVGLFIDTNSATETCVIFSEGQARSSTPATVRPMTCALYAISKAFLSQLYWIIQ